jgi:hypothetical protein
VVDLGGDAPLVGDNNGTARGCHYLVEGVIIANLLPRTGVSEESETLDLGLPNQTTATLSMSWSIVVEQVLAGGVFSWSSVASTTSTIASHGGMVQQGFPLMCVPRWTRAGLKVS